MGISYEAVILKGYECRVEGRSVLIGDVEVFKNKDDIDVLWEFEEYVNELGLGVEQRLEGEEEIFVGAVLAESNWFSEATLDDRKSLLDSFIEVWKLPEPKMFVIQRIC